MRIKNKIIKILLTSLILSISFVFPTFAEIEVEPTIDIYKNYEKV